MAEAEKRIEEFRSSYTSLTSEIGKVIVGHRDVIDRILMCLFAGGHALVEGLPGLGKTKLVATLSDCLDLGFKRIQFTPDLMPSDITGTDVLIRGEGGTKVEFQKGPVFTNILLADEINRATPRTQSALLEVMQERTVTVMGQTREIPAPFFVFATQNPIELEGTYPLPEAQLDRFMLKIEISAEGVEQLMAILDRFAGSNVPSTSRVMGSEDVLTFQELVREVILPEPVARLISLLVFAGNPQSDTAPEIVRKFVKYSPSPRAALSIASVAKVRALTMGRAQVSMDDVQEVAHSALTHRLLLNFEGEAAGIEIAKIIVEMINAAMRKL